MNDIREIKCEACPRICPEDYQKMVEKYSRACQERDRANELLQKGAGKAPLDPGDGAAAGSE